MLIKFLAIFTALIEMAMYRITIWCPALNGSKIKQISSTIKCTVEINKFSYIGPHSSLCAH
jgi:hypothetical protein